jgi:hypothetical protein
MNPAAAALLAHPALWRGDQCAPEPATLSTGFPALDAALPGGGWPSRALVEVMLEREGIGELRLTLPALAGLTRAGREVVWIAPPYRPYAPALAQAGVALPRLALVRCRDAREALWAFEQALKAPECGAAFAWLPEHDERHLRRLALAAREGRTLGILWRRPGQRARSASAPLRLGLDAREQRLAVQVLKRRGSELAAPILIDLASRCYEAPPAAGAVALPRMLPPRPSRPGRPDPRERAGGVPPPSTTPRHRLRAAS